MHTPGSRHRSFRARAGHFPLLVALAAAVLSAGACTLLVDAQLADKPAEDGGAEANESEGGHGGGSSTSSGDASSSDASSKSGVPCPNGFADCDGMAVNGCEAELKSDAKNCKSCGHACHNGKQCVGGACK